MDGGGGVMGEGVSQPPPERGPPPERQPPPERPPVLRELGALAERVRRGETAVLPRLREILDTHPTLWEHLGDVSRHVESAWLDLMVGQDPLGRAAIQRRAAQMRQELAGEHPTPTEKVLVDLVVNSWLELQQASYSQARHTGMASGSIQQANYRLRRSEAAQRKYLAALKSLATLRVLLPEGLAPLNGLRLYRGEEEDRQPA